MSEHSEDHPARDLRLHLWEPSESRPEVVAHVDPLSPYVHSLTTRRTVNVSGDSLRPLLVIDPEDEAAVRALCDAYRAVTHRGPISEAPGAEEILSQMQDAFRALANPTPEPMPEPTDPAVRVVDGDGETWARIGTRWYGDSGNLMWHHLIESGPLRIVTPDAPTPDVDRPLKMGDRVRVADDGERNAGREGLVLGCHMRLRYATVETDEAWPFVVQQRRLTRIPGGEA